MKSQLGKLLKFPCNFTYKVIGLGKLELLEQVIKVIQLYAPGNFSTKVKISQKRKYHSISVTIIATNINQIETLYQELSSISLVLTVL